MVEFQLRKLSSENAHYATSLKIFIGNQKASGVNRNVRYLQQASNKAHFKRNDLSCSKIYHAVYARMSQIVNESIDGHKRLTYRSATVTPTLTTTKHILSEMWTKLNIMTRDVHQTNILPVAV